MYFLRHKMVMQVEIHVCLWLPTGNLLLTKYIHYCERNYQLRFDVRTAAVIKFPVL
jgi:hypothetical protein